MTFRVIRRVFASEIFLGGKKGKMASVHYEIWDSILERPGSYQLKDALVWRAQRAIEEKNPSLLRGELLTFNPDYYDDLDYAYQHYTRKQIDRIIKNWGLVELVKRKIEEMNKEEK